MIIHTMWGCFILVFQTLDKCINSYHKERNLITDVLHVCISHKIVEFFLRKIKLEYKHENNTLANASNPLSVK